MEYAALYLRVSSDGQRERNTIASQKTILPKLAAEHRYTIYKSYVDDGISGETIADRPAFRALLDDALLRRFSAVIVIDFDRLTRPSDLGDLSLIKKIFRENNVKVITQDRVFDLRNMQDDIQTDNDGVAAKHEKMKMLARIRRGIKEKRTQGKWIMGTPPTPYERDGKGGKVIINPEKKKMVLSILKDARSMGLPSISEKYGLWRGQLPRMISRKRLLFFAGYIEVDQQLIRGQWEPIITMDEAQEILGLSRKRFNQRRYTAVSYLLTGLGIFRCGDCGRSIGSHTFNRERKVKKNMSGPSRIYRRGYYRCNNRRCKFRPRVRAADTIDALVLGSLGHHLGRLDLIREWARKIWSVEADQNEVDMIDRRITEEEGKVKNIVLAIAKGILRDDEAAASLGAIRGKIASLAASRAVLLGRAEGRPKLSDLDILAEASTFDLSFQGKRALIEATIEGLVFGEDFLEITYRFPINENGSIIEKIQL